MGFRIIRDADDMDAFANKLDEYVEGVQTACIQLRSAMDSSATLLGDRKSSEAVQRINELVETILSELYQGTETANTLRASAKPLHEASNIRFR